MKIRRTRNLIYSLLLAMLLGVVPLAKPAAAALPTCDVPTIQGLASAGTTISSATPKTTPVNYCDVKGFVSPHGTDFVNFELGLPNPWNGGLL